MIEWIDGLAWPWGMLLGAGAGTLLVVVFGITPLLLLDERKYRKQERCARIMREIQFDMNVDNCGFNKKKASKMKQEYRDNMKELTKEM